VDVLPFRIAFLATGYDYSLHPDAVLVPFGITCGTKQVIGPKATSERISQEQKSHVSNLLVLVLGLENKAIASEFVI
jgi:hypothetical protein